MYSHVFPDNKGRATSPSFFIQVSESESRLLLPDAGILFGVGIGSKKPMVGGLGWWFETNLNPYDLMEFLYIKTTFTAEYITFGVGGGIP